MWRTNRFVMKSLLKKTSQNRNTLFFVFSDIRLSYVYSNGTKHDITFGFLTLELFQTLLTTSFLNRVFHLFLFWYVIKTLLLLTVRCTICRLRIKCFLHYYYLFFLHTILILNRIAVVFYHTSFKWEHKRINLFTGKCYAVFSVITY